MIWRLVAAAASGLLVFASYAPLGWWPAGIVGLGLLHHALRHARSLREGALVGFVQALCLFLLLVPWVGEFVGPGPYIALSVALALFGILIGLGGVALRRGSVLLFPAWWVAVEYARSSWPFGGFAWVRLAWGQVDGPLAHLAFLGGPTLVTFGAAIVGCALFQLRHSARLAAVCALIPLGLGAGLAQWPKSENVGEVRVAAIQGNVPRMGLDFNAQRRAVLANHVRQTQRLNEPVDLVIWPENAADVDPLTDSRARELVDRAVAAAQAPVLVGTLTSDEQGPHNTMMVFDPTTGPGEYHHKKFLQPFGETMPLRSLLRRVSPYVDRAGDFQPGSGPGVVHAGGITLGVATCYEVIFDEAYRSAIAHGAQLLTTPTNNATFGFTDMTYQQLAMSRLRAIETDRAVVVAATSGVSAIIDPDGWVRAETKIFEPATLVDTLELRDSVTPAMRFGFWVQASIVIIGTLSVLVAVWRRRSSSSRL
ncbi:apolipoprotein N-acyltransferase [Corynebacterium sp. zg-331]|uniref:apolipoprotein N-acyltransferase n=1 Tax=unclassified Corynebacterium TaxID=2624378 RepID=UPI00128E1671|nr:MULTISPECIES: apolipoprotein N-acyltransferase [unclassified Corynebacterium]MBC3185577.1 apolipoprotein N-acyltransferase [Corynebacterium sp. zg-331]MPV52071.1 apolipoprotein N-acyltransferase [Corynebacterium sp. zg331]